MREKTISISERDLMYTVAGQLFDQAPNRQPRKAEIIMQKARDAFRKDAYNDNEFYSLLVPEKEAYKYIEKLLKGISEFNDLNLSQAEFESGVTVDDENRPKFSFTSRYDVHTSESWKTDFIDIDAFIRNVYNRLTELKDVDADCFLCIHQNYNGCGSTMAPGNDEECKNCTVNPELKFNYQCGREPKGEYTFSCRYDCPEHKMICCEECKKANGCPSKCDGNSETCGNKVME